MDAPFLRGISYLSWEEEAKARAVAAAEWARETLADISISPDDAENLQLMARVRAEIAVWSERTAVRKSSMPFSPAFLKLLNLFSLLIIIILVRYCHKNQLSTRGLLLSCLTFKLPIAFLDN